MEHRSNTDESPEAEPNATGRGIEADLTKAGKRTRIGGISISPVTRSIL